MMSRPPSQRPMPSSAVRSRPCRLLVFIAVRCVAPMASVPISAITPLLVQLPTAWPLPVPATAGWGGFGVGFPPSAAGFGPGYSYPSYGYGYGPGYNPPGPFSDWRTGYSSPAYGYGYGTGYSYPAYGYGYGRGIVRRGLYGAAWNRWR